MPENNNKVARPEAEIHSYIANCEPEGERDTDFIVTSVGSTKKCLQKYETVYKVPNVKKMAEEGRTIDDLFAFFEDRNINGQDVINKAMSTFSYRVKNTDAFDFDAEPMVTEDPENPDNPFIDYPLKEGGFAMLQQLADDYKAGQRAPAATKVVKSKAKKYDALMEKAKAAGFNDPQDYIDSILAQQ